MSSKFVANSTELQILLKDVTSYTKTNVEKTSLMRVLSFEK